MIIARLEMVIGSEFRQPSQGTNNLGKENIGRRFKDKLYNLDVVNAKNSLFKDSMTNIFVDWDKTLDYYVNKVGKGEEWLDYILQRKETECEDLKFNIGFNTTESYTKAVDKGRSIKNPNNYIVTVEKQIEEIKALEIVEEVVKGDDSFEYGGETIIVTDGMMEDLKAAIKEEGLGIRVGKEDSYGSVYMKVEEARKNK